MFMSCLLILHFYFINYVYLKHFIVFVFKFSVILLFFTFRF